MAWQASPGMGVSGMSGPGSDAGNNVVGHPQGTEYTLQGVMRFLQTEWHRHERDRNSWDIERAEMKSRIARLEGEARMGKRTQEAQGRLVKLLENALKRERDKVKALSANGNSNPNPESEEQKEESGEDGLAPDVASESERSKTTCNSSNSSTSEHPAKQSTSILITGKMVEVTKSKKNRPGEPDRERSRNFLGKFNQEFLYHMIPPAQPMTEDLQGELPPNHVYQNQQPQQSLDDMYLQPRQRQYPNNAREQSYPDYQTQMVSSDPNHVNMSRQNEQMQLPPSMMPRELSEEQLRSRGEPLTAFDHSKQKILNMSRPPNERSEQLAHPFEVYPREIPTNKDNFQNPQDVSNSEGWDFSEPATTTAEQLPEYVTPQRPDTDAFPSAATIPPKSPPRPSPGSHRRKSSGARRKSDIPQSVRDASISTTKTERSNFKVRYALRGHLDVVRSVIFSGGGTPAEPEICTAGDDGVIKRWIIPASYGGFIHGNSNTSGNNLDVTAYFTHRGHTGSVLSLAACPASQNISNGGRALGDGWIFSGGQDTTIRVWERGRVDPKATLDGHTDAIWALCVLPGNSNSIFGDECSHYGGPERILLASGAADGTILIWAVSAPPQLTSPQTSGGRRGPGGRRANSVSSGSNFPSSPQPSVATTTPFNYSLVHRIQRIGDPSPTCICPLSIRGSTFVVSFTDASVLVYDTRTGEEVIGMATFETYDGTPNTGVNCVVASTMGFEPSMNLESGRGASDDETLVHGATGSSGGVEGIVISGHEDRFIRFFDANSGQCTYTMLAHPAAIASVSLSPDGRELVSAGHDASLRFWSLEKRSCVQEITSHRLMRGEGVCSVVWSQDGRFVVSGGGDGVVKVFGR